MAMSKERRGEIALKVMVSRAQKEGFGNLRPNEMRRRVVAASKEFAIPQYEAAEFAEWLIRDVMECAIKGLLFESGSDK